MYFVALRSKHSTKTNFHVSYANRFTILAFVNSSLLDFFYDVLMNGNIIAKGGLIEHENMFFVILSIVTIFGNIIHPYSVWYDMKRGTFLRKEYWTAMQEVVHNLVQPFIFVVSARFAIAIKGLWFYFLYSLILPLGAVFSIGS